METQKRADKFLDDLVLDGRNSENGFDELCLALYRDKIERIFDGVPIDRSYETDGDILHYKYGLYDYLKGIYGIFREIILTEIEPDLLASTPDIYDEEEQRAYYLKATRFVRAVKLKGLRQGGCVDRYVKDLPLISPFIGRLVVKRKGRFILKNSDTGSLDYKLALLSCFQFYGKSAKVFELKTLRREEVYNE